MMAQCGWMLCVLICLAARGTADEPKTFDKILATDVSIPKGVVYRKAAEDVNRKALEKLSKALLVTESKESPTDLFTSKLICGTGVWSNIKKDTELKGLKNGRVNIQVPNTSGNQVLEGKLFQTSDELTSFWRVFQKQYKPGPDLAIRRPTADELSLYWAMIPYDITEPIFMVESKDAKLLAHFTTDEVKISWIDDFQNMKFVPGK